MDKIDVQFIQSKQKEYYKECPSADTLIIFIHGILEGPNQFKHLGYLAYREGCSILILLLPGHGTSSRAFSKSSLYEWVDYVNLRIQRMEQSYEHIILVGHSMGALLAVAYTLHFPKKIVALVTLAIPLVIRVWPRVLIGALKIREGQLSFKERYAIAECRAMGIDVTTIRGYGGWIPRYLDLFILINYVGKRLNRLKLPILVIQSYKDEFVDLRSHKILKRRLSDMQLLVLKDSGHFCYHHTDLLELEKTFLVFLRKQLKVTR